MHWSGLDHLRRLLDNLRCLLDNLPLHSLDLGNFNNLFDVLNVWNVNLPDLLLNDDFWNMPNDFALFNWAWHVDMPVNNRNLGNFYNFFDMLNLRDVDMMMLFFGDRYWHMANLFNCLHWAWNVDVPLNYLNLRNFHDPLDVLDLWNVDFYNLLLSHKLGHMADDLACLHWPRNMNMPLNYLNMWHFHVLLLNVDRRCLLDNGWTLDYGDRKSVV